MFWCSFWLSKATRNSLWHSQKLHVVAGTLKSYGNDTVKTTKYIWHQWLCRWYKARSHQINHYDLNHYDLNHCHLNHWHLNHYHLNHCLYHIPQSQMTESMTGLMTESMKHSTNPSFGVDAFFPPDVVFEADVMLCCVWVLCDVLVILNHIMLTWMNI